MILTCPSCGRKNRSPAGKLAEVGRCGACKTEISPPGKPIDADPEIFREVTRDATVPVLVDFWAEWCGPCKMIAPILDEIATEYAGKVTVAKINVDENPKTPMKFSVRGIPTLILFKDGKAEGQKIGAVRKAELSTFLDGKL
jgi:thioredoxin